MFIIGFAVGWTLGCLVLYAHFYRVGLIRSREEYHKAQEAKMKGRQ